MTSSFPRGSDAAVLYAHASAPPPRISERRPELPAKLDRLFERALAKDPAERPESARGFVAAVREALGEQAIAELGPPEAGGLGGDPSQTLTTPGSGAPPRDASRTRRVGTMAVALAAAAALGAGAMALLGDDGEDAAVAEVPVPSLLEGAQALGSDLPAAELTLDCGGSEPTRISPACVIAQTDLPGAQLVAPADGTIVGWSVRGAHGDLALDVIRPGADDDDAGRALAVGVRR